MTSLVFLVGFYYPILCILARLVYMSRSSGTEPLQHVKTTRTEARSDIAKIRIVLPLQEAALGLNAACARLDLMTR